MKRTSQLHPTGEPSPNICPGTSSIISKSPGTWSFSHVWFSATPWTVARQDPLSIGILQNLYSPESGSPVFRILKNSGEGYHALLQRIFPTQGLNPSPWMSKTLLNLPSCSSFDFVETPLLLCNKNEFQHGLVPPPPGSCAVLCITPPNLQMFLQVTFLLFWAQWKWEFPPRKFG